MQSTFVPGQSSTDVLTGIWMMSNIQWEKEKEKWGNNEAALKTNALGEKSVYFFFSFDYQNYIAGLFHNNFWYGEKLKNAERYQCNHQLIKMSHFLQHVEVITNFLLLSLDWDNFLVSGNIRKIEFKSVLFYYSHLNYFPLQRKPVLSWGCMKNVCVCDNFNITSNSRNWRSHRIKNVTARTGY